MAKQREPRRVQLQVRVKPEVKARLRDAAERRYTSESRLTEMALVATLDRIDMEDAPVMARRRRLAALEEA